MAGMVGIFESYGAGRERSGESARLHAWFIFIQKRREDIAMKE